MTMTMTKPSALFLGLIFLLALSLVLLGGLNRPDGIAEPGAATASMTRIVFFGDSITESGDRPGGYVSIIRDTLKEEYPNRSLEVLGAGIAGNKVPDLQARVERDVIDQSPTHVVIYIGINDVWHDEFEGLTGEGQQVYEQGLRDLIDQIHQAGAEVLLCTPSVIGENPDSSAPVNQRLMDYAEISRTVARTTGAHLCDLRTAFEQHLRAHNPGRVNAGVLTTDGVHLNYRGNRFVADVLLEYLHPLLGP
jgi:lysophospholipase L1-like esterase